MTEIRNTTADMQDPAGLSSLLFLASALDCDGASGFIEAQEAAGQRQLVNSSQLPTKIQRPGTISDFEAVGFTFGETMNGDDLFRPATLPAGWSKRGSDHAMWSYIDDELGRERVAIFYKAAFYDRRAFMRLVDVHGYVWSCHDNESPIVTDDTWATREAVHQALVDHAADARERVASWTEIRDRPGQRESSVRSANEYIPQYTAEAERYEALAKAYEAVE